MPDFLLDTIEITEKVDGSPLSAFLFSQCDAKAERHVAKGLHGYTRAAQWNDNAVRVDFNPPDDDKRRDMGIHWAINGRAKDMFTGGNLALGIHIARRFDCKFTRCDVSIDDTGSEGIKHPADFEKELRDAMKDGDTRKRNLGHYMRDVGGYTMSAGSPQSDVYALVYDKAAEQKITEFLWTRYEFRTRRHVADGIRHELSISPDPVKTVKSIAAGFMLSFYGKGLSDSVLEDVWGFHPQFISQGHKTVNPDWWLFSTAAKAVANRMNDFEKTEDAKEWLKEFMRNVWKKTHHQR